MATTYNFTDGSIAGQVVPRIYNTGENEPYIIHNFLDFSKQSLDVSASDVAQAIAVKPESGITVLAAWIRIITPESAGATAHLGYGGDPDHWGADLALDSAAGSILRLPTTTDAPPVYFSGDDTIDIVGTGSVDIDGLKCEVVALCINTSDSF